MSIGLPGPIIFSHQPPWSIRTNWTPLALKASIPDSPGVLAGIAQLWADPRFGEYVDVVEHDGYGPPYPDVRPYTHVFGLQLHADLPVDIFQNATNIYLKSIGATDVTWDLL